MSFIVKNIKELFIDDIIKRPRKQIDDNYELLNHNRNISYESINGLNIYVQNTWLVPAVSKDTKERFMKIKEIIKEENFDVIVLLEVWSQNYREQLIEISQNTLYNHYNYVCGTGIPAWPYVNGSGIMIFSKLEIIDAQYHAYSVNGKPHMMQHTDYYGGKGVGLCELRTSHGDIELYITHTHASYEEDNRDYYSCRTLQIYEFCEFVKQTHKNNLAILLGDFNTQEGELPYRYLLDNFTDLKDAYIKCNNDKCDYVGASTYSAPDNTYADEEPQRLDYLFYLNDIDINGKLWTAKECNIIKYYTETGHSLSDHFGLSATFKYTNPEENSPNDNNEENSNILHNREKTYNAVRHVLEKGVIDTEKERRHNYFYGFFTYIISLFLIIMFHNSFSNIMIFIIMLIPMYSMYEILYTKFILCDNIRHYKEVINQINLLYPKNERKNTIDIV